MVNSRVVSMSTDEELMARDKVNLDIFWLRDESLGETANLPAEGISFTEPNLPILIAEIARLSPFSVTKDQS
jgi:type I restriction enzyme M protein